MAGVSKKVVFLGHFVWICLATLALATLQPDVCFTPQQDIHFHSQYSWRYTVVSSDEASGRFVTKVDDVGNGCEVKANCELDEGVDVRHGDLDDSSSDKGAKADDAAGMDEERREVAPVEDDESLKPAQHFCSVLDAVKSWEFNLLLVYGSLTLLRFNFYLSTALRRIDEADGGTLYVDILFLLLPLIGGMSSIVFVTIVMRNFGINGVSRVATMLGLVYGCLVLAPGKLSLLMVFITISLHRAFFFSFSYPYILTVFGHDLYGRLNGILMTTSGAISLLQYPLIDFAERICGGQYFYIDLVVFAISGVCLLMLLIPLNEYVSRIEKS